MRVRWVALVQVLLLVGTLVTIIPALVQWGVWNGLDLLAVIFLSGFITSCFIIEEKAS